MKIRFETKLMSLHQSYETFNHGLEKKSQMLVLSILGWGLRDRNEVTHDSLINHLSSVPEKKFKRNTR